MTLRRKTLVIVAATLLGLLAGFFVLTRLTLLRRFRDYEVQQTHQEMQQAKTALDSELANLSTIAHDDAEWDDAYEFVQRPNRRFVQSNFPHNLLGDFRLDVVEYLDASGNVILQQFSDSAGEQSGIAEGLRTLVLNSQWLAQPTATNVPVNGVLVLADRPLMIAVSPVVRSDGSGPPKGVMIVARRFDQNEVHRLSLLTRLELQVHRINDPALPTDYRAAAEALSRLKPVVTRPVDSHSIRGYELINDIEGKPALILSARLTRSVYEQGKDTELFLMGSVLALGLTFSLVTMFLLEKLVLSRLIGLGRNVESIGARGDLAARLPVVGHDELTEVSDLINRMLQSLERVEQERRQQEERYRAYITQSTEGIWRCELQAPLPISLPFEKQIEHLHKNLYFSECNEALARLHGFATPRDMEGVAMRSLFDISNTTNMELARKFLDSGYSIADAESVGIDKQGHTRYFVNNISGVIEHGMLVRIWGAQREVTHQRRLEAQLRQAQKMEAMGRLAGGVAHDFNNLLSVVHGYTEILQKRFRPEEAGYKEAQQVLHATEKAAGLTNQLLAFGRKQILAPRILDLNSVIRDLDRMVRRLVREDIELVIRTEPDLWLVRADPGQMEQVIINLAVNASDAIPSGGCVTVETTNLLYEGGLLGQDPPLKPGRYVVLTVTDTGIGMDAETRGKIFEPFFTTKDVGKGTGLGLATVYGIVQQSGGQISVYSEPGRGSVFKIFLPHAEGVPEAVVRPVKRDPVPNASGTVLLVEDDPSVRQLAREVLEGRGYTVLTAASGNEALQKVETRETNIDLVVTDVIMPGMAGDELVEHLRLRRPDLKVVFVSGYASDSIPRIVPNSYTSFLQKPFPVEDLVRTVYEMIVGKGEETAQNMSSQSGQTAT